MPNDTTPAENGGGEPNDAPQDNWEQRYSGLQRVLAKRDEALATATADLDSLRATHDAAIAELETFRQRDAEANEEATARQTYEQLRERFEMQSVNPVPVGSNPQRDWVDVRGDYAERERTGTESGFPI